MKGERFAAFGKAFQLLTGSTAGSVAVGIHSSGGRGGGHHPLPMTISVPSGQNRATPVSAH